MSDPPACPVAEGSDSCENTDGGYTRSCDPQVQPAEWRCASCGAYFSAGPGGATVVGP